MTKKPLINSVLAVAYIALVASLMFYGPKFAGDKEDNVFMPMAMISLFTLSAAIMGYLFLYQPLRLLLEGNKKEAVGLFLKTVLIFAAITAAAFLTIFLKN